MNSSQHRCMNQASASEGQTQQCPLNSSLGDTVGSPLIHLGGQLLNGSTSILPNVSPQLLFTSVIYGLWCTTFASSLILDSPILPCTVYFYNGGTRTVPPLARKSMIMPFWTSDKLFRFCITPTIVMFSGALTHLLHTLNCTVLPPAFSNWLFNADVEKLIDGCENVAEKTLCDWLNEDINLAGHEILNDDQLLQCVFRDVQNETSRQKKRTSYLSGITVLRNQ
ncbi:calmodulin [Trichonephila clavipes]|nr:calmodulin [Trichonephila clavipes]